MTNDPTQPPLGKERSKTVTIEVMDDATAEMLRAKTPAERLAMAFALNRRARNLVAGGVRWQHPDWNDEQVQREVVRRMSCGST